MCILKLPTEIDQENSQIEIPEEFMKKIPEEMEDDLPFK